MSLVRGFDLMHFEWEHILRSYLHLRVALCLGSLVFLIIQTVKHTYLAKKQ